MSLTKAPCLLCQELPKTYQSKFWSAVKGSSSSSCASGANLDDWWCFGGSGGGRSRKSPSTSSASALRLVVVARSSRAGSLGGWGEALPGSGSPDAMSWHGRNSLRPDCNMWDSGNQLIASNYNCNARFQAANTEFNLVTTANYYVSDDQDVLIISSP